MSETVRLIHVQATALAVVRDRVNASDLSTIVPRYCGVVWNFTRSHALKAGRHVAVYLNTGIDVEVGVEVEGTFEADGPVVPSATPAGMVATAVHLGPYQRLGDTHNAVRTWIKAHNFGSTGVCWEIYDHWRAAWDNDPSQIRTDVFYQLRQT